MGLLPRNDSIEEITGRLKAVFGAASHCAGDETNEFTVQLRRELSQRFRNVYKDLNEQWRDVIAIEGQLPTKATIEHDA
jgi:hypothetical protein